MPLQTPSCRLGAAPRLRLTLAALTLGSAALWGCAWAQPAAPGTPVPPTPVSPASDDDDPRKPYRSALDAALLYQLLIGEIEAGAGRSAQGFEAIFDAAKRTRDDGLFKRSVQLAVQGRDIDLVVNVVRSWRQHLPSSLEAMRYQLQAAIGFNRMADAAEPLTALLDASPAEDRASIVTALPALFDRGSDRREAAKVLDPVLEAAASRYPALRIPTLVTQGRLWAAAGDIDKARALAERAQSLDGSAKEPVLLALELMPRDRAAESIVKTYLAKHAADSGMSLAYAQTLTQQQRIVDAMAVVQKVIDAKPDNENALLTVGALRLELRQPKEAEAALQRYLRLTSGANSAAQGTQGSEDATKAAARDGAAQAARVLGKEIDPSEAAQGDAEAGQDDRGAGRTQAFLMLSQAADQRGDSAAAAKWLDRIDPDGPRALELQQRRAVLMAKQGRVAQARALLKSTPEFGVEDARAKIVAESQLLRDVKQWKDAHDVLAEGVKRFPTDIDLMYEQAMMAEKLDRIDDMERLLRRVMAERPTYQHAYNALGYTLADRGLRLPEARQLVSKALELAPGDPFITDSLGWIEFRMGNRTDALRLLREAWATRPDTEIGAHLGEVLWAMGQKDEARRIWRESRARDANNDVLRETLARLKVDL
jgi:tetratricopeptide (TPR) repeat protein